MATTSMDPKVALNLPTYERPELKERLLDLTLMSDLLAGSRKMWRKARLYIRKWADEHEDVYGIRARCEQVFEGLGRTLSAAVGMMFSRPPEIEWGPAEARLTPHWDNIDGAGTKGDIFLKRFAEASVRDGVGVIVVDHPKAPVNEKNERLQVTADMDERLGLRPRWASYPRANVLSWRYDTVNNRQTLTQIVLSEPRAIPDGTFGVTHTTRWRRIYLAVPKGAGPNPDGSPAEPQALWEVWEATQDQPTAPEHFRVTEGGAFRSASGAAMPFLPVSVATVGKPEGDPLVASIPLLGVAWANLGHWQQASNLRFYRELAAFPQPSLLGNLDEEMGVDAAGNPGMVPGRMRFGPLVVVHLSADGEAPAEFKYVAPPVEAFEPLIAGCQEKMEAMAALGMSFLARDKRTAETAEAKRLDATAENATLATASQGIEDAANYAWEIHGWYMDIPKADCPVVTFNRDYDAIAMEAGVMSVWVDAVKNADVPPRVLLEAWKAGGRLPPDTDIDALEMEILGAMAAKAEIAAKLASAQAARPPTPPPGQKQVGADEEEGIDLTGGN